MSEIKSNLLFKNSEVKKVYFKNFRVHDNQITSLKTTVGWFD